MDSRLFNIETRPTRLRQQDLPLVARAILSLYRKQAVVKTGFVKNLGYVRIETPTFHVQIIASDWALIEPFVRDQSFDQAIVKSQQDTVWINPLAVKASSVIDRTDRQYYLKVLATLQGLFPEAYPTSTL